MAAEEKRMIRIYIGTYTSDGSDGIYRCYMDSRTGALSDLQPVARADNPTFLALSSDTRFLYSVSEVREHDQRSGGAVDAFSRDRSTGNLTWLN